MTVKNVSCWFTVKANNVFDLKLLAVLFTFHLLIIFCWMVVAPQCHIKVSFCKLLSFCRQCREENDWKRRWKIGHSCSLYFPNVPPPLQAPQPANAILPPHQPHLPDTYTQTHTTLCLLSSTPHVSCVYFLDTRGKKRLHIPMNTCLPGEGCLVEGRRGQATLNVHGCFAVCSTGKQCHHVVQLNFTTRKVNKLQASLLCTL